MPTAPSKQLAVVPNPHPGRDYEVRRPGAPRLGTFKNEMTGCGPFLHDDPADRPPHLTASTQTLWHGPGRESYLLLPVIPGG